MGRKNGFLFGLLGLLFPGYFLYISDGSTTDLFFQGFFYDFLYKMTSSGNESSYNLITSQWVQTDFFGSSLESYLYMASFALLVIGLIVILIHAKSGALLFLISGLADLGLMLLHSPVIDGISGSVSIFPLPIGAAILLFAAFVGFRDPDSTKVVSWVKKKNGVKIANKPILRIQVSVKLVIHMIRCN